MPSYFTYPHLLRFGLSLRLGVQLMLVLSLAGIASLSYAAEAARVVFVAGSVRAGDIQVVLDQAVQEGDRIVTGADGYVYLKTIDEGFLILRPNSDAKIVAYTIDKQHPENSHVKLELTTGVARSISGEGVKQSKQNFRFNTPVAAIGVRGTDFTVFTNQTTSRVAVVSGAIVVSAFEGGCRPEGGGPCEGAASRELFANQIGQLLQVNKGQAVPQLLRGSNVAPDNGAAPARSDEPAGKVDSSGKVSSTLNTSNTVSSTSSGSTSTSASGSTTTVNTATSTASASSSTTAGTVTVSSANSALTPTEIGVTTEKDAALQKNILASGTPLTIAPVVVVAPVVVPVASQIIWGRWQAVLDQGANVDVAKLVNGGASLISINNQFALLRQKAGEWQVPHEGSIGFALQNSEAYMLDNAGGILNAAKVENGKLNVDFAKSSFTTSIDLVNQTERFSLQAKGAVTANGLLNGESQFSKPTNMDVSGALGAEKSDAAAYLFQARIDADRSATGITSWAKTSK